MIRLPIPGQDDNVWGTILNDFLSTEHNADGTLKNVARPSDITPLKNTIKVNAYGADPTGVASSDAAVAAAKAALGNAPGTIEFGPGIYKLTTSMGTFGVAQGVRGAGRGTTTINFSGSGDCIRAYDSRAYGGSIGVGIPGDGGVFRGFRQPPQITYPTRGQIV